MQFDFDGLIQLLAGHLYSEKQVFLRELMQNSCDSITRRRAKDPLAPTGRVEIRAYPEELVLEVADNGGGMTDQDLAEFLSTIGKSGTRLEKQSIDGLVGQFGIGFLASFLVGKRVEVITRRFDSAQGWSWVNEGRKDYDLTPCSVPTVGTTVRVHLKGAEERGILYEEELRALIRKYADMLPVPIHLNGHAEAVNLQTMPWEQSAMSETERAHACHLFLEEKMPDHILEVIPFALSAPCRASGILYLTKTRTVGIEIPRSVRLYLRRMFLCENAPDLLPKWATFVNGIINAEDLTPTAARENYIRDHAADQLRVALGEVILAHLKALHAKDPERFRQIQHYHALGIKAACDYHGELYAKLADVLLWRTNWRADERDAGRAHAWKTLPQILAGLPKVDGEPHVLSCFTDHNSANQYFQMADAVGTLVVDASYVFEDRLLKAYTKLPGVHLRLVHVDREEDPALFRPLSGQEGSAVTRLANTMGALLQPGGQRLHVEACRFDPPELTAVLRATEQSVAAAKARAILDDPNLSRDVRQMTEELLRFSKDAALKLVINAANPLVRRLAALDSTHPSMGSLLLGLYHSALIHNTQLLTSTTARQLHGHMEQLMGQMLTLLEMVSTFQRQQDCVSSTVGSAEAVRHEVIERVIVFLTAGGLRSRMLEDVIREVAEDQWGYRLVVSDGEDPVCGRRAGMSYHVEGLLVDLYEANPGMLVRLGKMLATVRGERILLLQEKDSPGRIMLPAECLRYSCLRYDSDSAGTVTSQLREAVESHPAWATMLSHPQRDRYVSSRLLRSYLKMELPDSMYVTLSHTFPQVSTWSRATVEDVAPVLRDYAPLAERVVTHMREALNIVDVLHT
jgi:molecular chaperone HtpG